MRVKIALSNDRRFLALFAEFRLNSRQEPPARRVVSKWQKHFIGAEMADNSRGDGASPVLALLVGGLIVAVAVLGYFTLTGHQESPGTPSHITMNIKTPTPPTHP